MQNGDCSICNSPSQLDLLGNDPLGAYEVKCPRCGDYFISDYAKDAIEKALQLDKRSIATHLSMGDVPDNSVLRLYIEVAKKAADRRGVDVPRSIISHVLRKRINKRATLTWEVLADVLKNNSLPTPAEQANNFVTYLGGCLSSPGDTFGFQPRSNELGRDIYGLLGIKIGEAESKDLNFVAAALEEQKLLNVGYGLETSAGRKNPVHASLTLAGWQKYEELQRSVKDSRKAFMAMEFPSSAKTTANYFFQNTLLDEYIIPAVKKTGYDLTNALRTEPMAGNIHARLEVEIRTARFVVAELSHHNNGAYWEAGFARGLGKPVIYMYNKGVGNSDRPHFDVGSDHYVAWEENQPDKAADDLKAVIRATLFGEAAMED
jgi:nucleoside 2-deoxyribosyltransferase